MKKFLTPEEFSLDDIFKGKYTVPIYQRPYSWGKVQVKQLLVDIDEAFRSYIQNDSKDADDSVLFAGNIFIKAEANVRNEYVEYSVVDGQQRITTLTLLLMVLLNSLYQTNSDDDCIKDIKNYLWKKEERKNSKEKRALILGNIDKEILIELFDQLYSKKDIIVYAKQILEQSSNQIELNLINNLLFINDYLKKYDLGKEIFDYIDFIKYNIKVISIKIDTNIVKLFNIFESINSKGKPLDDIDLIKSYIFQNLHEDDHDEYLKKWGKLIEQTQDKLNDYFTIYIRANISYYKHSVKLENFKSLSNNQLKSFFGEELNLADTLKLFIDDMLTKVKYYRMLFDVELLEKEHVSDVAIAFFNMNRIAKYNHTEPFFFKLLSLRGSSISEENFNKLVSHAFRFVLSFQTISSRESKQTIKVFSDVQNELYKVFGNYYSLGFLDNVAVENILLIFNKAIFDNAISKKTLYDSIRNSMTYKKNKDAVKILLSYINSSSSNNSTNYLYLKNLLAIGKDIHVDHILPQSPNKTDENFKYYLVDDIIVLKEGQDFTADKEQERISAGEFYDKYIHIIGNLRLEWANENIKKSNHLIKLEEFDNSFNSFVNIKEREKVVINSIIDSDILLSVENIDYHPENIKVKRELQITDYSQEIEYKFYHPISFELFNEKIKLNTFNWQGLLSEFFDTLYNLERDRLIEIAKEKFKPTGSNTIYVSDEENDIRKPYVLGNKVFVESNLSPQYMILLFYKIIESMGLDKKDLKIIIEEK